MSFLYGLLALAVLLPNASTFAADFYVGEKWHEQRSWDRDTTLAHGATCS